MTSLFMKPIFCFFVCHSGGSEAQSTYLWACLPSTCPVPDKRALFARLRRNFWCGNDSLQFFYAFINRWGKIYRG